MKWSAVLGLLGACGPAAAQCNPVWSAVGGGVGGEVDALAAFDGSLYVGGDFASTGGGPAASVAAWDGSSWSALGPGMQSSVLAMTAYNGKLVVGGWLQASGMGINFWDGHSWSAPTPGIATFSWIGAMGAYGGQLFVSGGFAGNNQDYVARYDGAAWLAAGTGFTTVAMAFVPFDDGHGPSLFATGALSIPGQATGFYFVRWDGQGWQSVGGGLDDLGYALAVYDDGSGPALYVGGSFTGTGALSIPAGASPASRIARWNGQTWSPLGSGVDGTVRALAVYDDGSGSALYAGGDFNAAGGVPALHIARWRAGAWSAVGTGVNGTVRALAAYRSPTSTRLYVGGTFTSAGDQPAANLAAWGPAWSANCDNSTAPPVLNIQDFQCFLNRFASASGSANCDGSTTPPVLNVQDFTCFLNRFAAGCS